MQCIVISSLALINEVNQRRARLELRCGTIILVCDQPPRSAQPGHLFGDRRSEYQLKGGHALRLGIRGRYGTSPCYTRVITEHFRDKEFLGVYKFEQAGVRDTG